jgi:CRP-like cAMP-binding protein
MQPVINFLSAFSNISEEEMSAILSVMHTSSHKKNDILHQQGAIPKRAAFIIKGAVRSFYIDENGQEQTVAFKFENQPLVPIESFTQQLPANLSVVTLEPTELIWTSHSEFFGFLETFPKYEKVLRNILSKNLMQQNEQMKLLRINASRERYEMLCKLQPEVVQRVPLKHIASYLGIALETLSRLRANK